MKKKRKNRSIILSLLALWLVVSLAFSGFLLYYLGKLSITQLEQDISQVGKSATMTRQMYDLHDDLPAGALLPYAHMLDEDQEKTAAEIVERQLKQATEGMSELDYVDASFFLCAKDGLGTYRDVQVIPEENWGIQTVTVGRHRLIYNLSACLSQEELELVEGYLSENRNLTMEEEGTAYVICAAQGWYNENEVYPTLLQINQGSYQMMTETFKASTVGIWEKELPVPENTEGMTWFTSEDSYPDICLTWLLEYGENEGVPAGLNQLCQKGADFYIKGLYQYNNSLVNIYFQGWYYVGGSSDEGLYVEGNIPVLKNNLSILGMAWGGSLLLFGLVGGILIVHNNHYEQRRADLEERRRQQARAVAHDLKTPLAVISAYAENISENLHPEKHAQYAGQILEETQRMNSGIQRLLQMDRVEGGQLSLERFDLGQLTRAVLRRYQQSIEEKKLTVRVEGNTQLTGDRELISQVVDNFLSNAVRYTPERGEIEIRLEEGKFSIQNQGKGIPEEKLSHIWEPYYQAEPERNPGGNGLGLTIAKAALDQHGFRCGARNTEDGVTFYFTW